MNTQTLKNMVEVDEHHPWYQARMELIYGIVQKDLSKDSKILDFGCGSGAVLEMLKNKGYKKIEGVDVSKACVNLVKKRGIKASLTSPNFLKLNKNKYDLILLLDVLEHIQNDFILLKNLKSMLRDTGKVLITVPAHQFLWRQHDEVNQHYRRYSREKIVNLISKCSFKFVVLRWWNSTLFFAFVCNSLYGKLSKALGKNLLRTKNEFVIPPIFISKILYRILSFEAKSSLMGRLIGVSLVAYVKK